MAVEAEGDDGKDELNGAKRKVEVKHVDGAVVNRGSLSDIVSLKVELKALFATSEIRWMKERK